MPSVTLVGTVTDALAGVAGQTVTCNDIPVAVSGGALSCQVTLVSGTNQIVIHDMDLAGNAAQTSVNLTTQVASPTQHPRIVGVTPGAGSGGRPDASDVTAQVDVDSTLLPTTVTLARYDTQTQQHTPLGRMYDDGTHGDALKGDNVFTVVLASPNLRRPSCS
jgi:hypothetical protein